MHVFMSSTINLLFGMFVLSINAKKKIYIYIADASADALLPRFLENDASASKKRFRFAPASSNIDMDTNTLKIEI